MDVRLFRSNVSFCSSSWLSCRQEAPGVSVRGHQYSEGSRSIYSFASSTNRRTCTGTSDVADTPATASSDRKATTHKR